MKPLYRQANPESHRRSESVDFRYPESTLASGSVLRLGQHLLYSTVLPPGQTHQVDAARVLRHGPPGAMDHAPVHDEHDRLQPEPVPQVLHHLWHRRRILAFPCERVMRDQPAIDRNQRRPALLRLWSGTCPCRSSPGSPSPSNYVLVIWYRACSGCASDSGTSKTALAPPWGLGCGTSAGAKRSPPSRAAPCWRGARCGRAASGTPQSARKTSLEAAWHRPSDRHRPSPRR